MPFKNQVDLLTSTAEIVGYWDERQSGSLVLAPGALESFGTSAVPLVVRKYETLIVAVKTDRDTNSNTAPVAGEKHAVRVEWFGEAVEGFSPLLLGAVEYDNNFPDIVGSRWTIPVRGPRCTVWYINRSTADITLVSPGASHAFTVVGNNFRRRDRVEWKYGESAVQYGGPLVQRIGEWEASPFAYANGPVFLNGLGNQITASLRISGAVTAAGVMRIRSTHNQSVIYAEAPIPVLGTFQTVTLSARIPMSTPVDIAFSAPTTAAASHLSVTWEDYDKAI